MSAAAPIPEKTPPTINPAGVSATTSLGSLTVTPLTPAVLSGLSATTSVNSLTTTQLTIASLAGLGQTATASVNVDKIILRYYQELYPRTSASYSNKTPRTSASYSTKTPRTSASYTDKVAS